MNDKLKGMKEGEVLTRAISQKRGLLSQTVTQELKNDSTAKRKLGETMGFK